MWTLFTQARQSGLSPCACGVAVLKQRLCGFPPDNEGTFLCDAQTSCPGVPKYQSEDISSIEDELADVWPSYKGKIAPTRAMNLTLMIERVLGLCMHAYSSWRCDVMQPDVASCHGPAS